MRKVWVTRSQPGADRSAKVLREAGYEPVIIPLLMISSPEIKSLLPPRNAIIILTSQNALGQLVLRTNVRDWTIISVGDATAKAAMAHGFSDVQSAGGTSENIVGFIQCHYFKSERPFWHLSGNNVRGSIIEDLSKIGYKAERHIYYVSTPVSSLPEIGLGGVDCVLLYSPLAANTLQTLNPNIKHMSVVSLSSAVDEALGGLCLKSRHIAAQPNEKALIRALDCVP